MEKNKVFILLSSLMLVACSSNTQTPSKAYDPYADRYGEDAGIIQNTYTGDKKDFYLDGFYGSDAGGVITTIREDNDVYHILYDKSTSTNYANVATTVIGRLSDFTYLNIHAKGNLGQPISIRAWYDDNDNYQSNIFGVDNYISLRGEYKTYSLKVKKTYQTYMDLLCGVAIYPEIGQASNGEFYFDKVWFSTTLPENAEWANPKVDSGGESIVVNDWETFSWTNYNLFPLGPNETGLKYVKAAEWGNVQYKFSEDDEREIFENNKNSVKFSFKDNVDILNRKSISAITFKLVGDKIGEGVTPEGYEYNIYQEYVMYHYIARTDYDSHVDEQGYVNLTIPLTAALVSIGDLHKDGYYFSMLIESDPGFLSEYQFTPSGDMSFKRITFIDSGEEIDPYSQGAGEYQYVLSDKDGVEKNVSYTNMPSNTFWPRVERLVLNSNKNSTIEVLLRNNSDHVIKIGAHAGLIDGVRSDAKNNNFFPLWSYGERNDDGYFTDGQNFFIPGGEELTITMSVNYSQAKENDKIEVIQFLIDNCWNNDDEVDYPDYPKIRSGNLDFVSVTVS